MIEARRSDPSGSPARQDVSRSDFGLTRTMRTGTLTAAIISAVFLAASVPHSDSQAQPPAPAPASDTATGDDTAAGQSPHVDPQNVMGVFRGDCKKCHPSEVAAWMKTTHYQSSDLRLLSFKGNTQKYAEALKISREDLLGDSLCADCHGTKSVVNGEVKVVSGVSCESCHGASGGEGGWLSRHQSYHDSQPLPRNQETPEHRAARIADCEAAGMIRAPDIFNQAQMCFRCHVVSNGDLIAAGHKMSSAAFEYVAWSEGEVRHNFLLDRTQNAKAPSLWQEMTNGSTENRRRIKFVAGTLAQLEAMLRARAEMKNPVVIPQIGGGIAALNGKLAQLNATAPTAEVGAITGIIGPMLATLFAPLPDDKAKYNKAADDVARHARHFVASHDGSKLAPLDTMINLAPPHFSQQFRQKYLRE